MASKKNYTFEHSRTTWNIFQIALNEQLTKTYNLVKLIVGFHADNAYTISFFHPMRNQPPSCPIPKCLWQVPNIDLIVLSINGHKGFCTKPAR